jgi:phenylalanyl-tRNA synthetase beta chain
MRTLQRTVLSKMVIKKIKEINVHSLKKILLFDLYVGKNIPEDKKSLGMGFIFQEKNKTLTHDEVDVFMNSIIDKLQKKFNIQLRK